MELRLRNLSLWYVNGMSTFQIRFMLFVQIEVQFQVQISVAEVIFRDFVVTDRSYKGQIIRDIV